MMIELGIVLSQTATNINHFHNTNLVENGQNVVARR